MEEWRSLRGKTYDNSIGPQTHTYWSSVIEVAQRIAVGVIEFVQVFHLIRHQQDGIRSVRVPVCERGPKEAAVNGDRYATIGEICNGTFTFIVLGAGLQANNHHQITSEILR